MSGPTARRAHRAPHTSQLRPWQVHLRGSHYRTDIAAAAAEGRVLVPGTA